MAYAQGNTIEAADYNNFYTRLNNIRQRYNIGVISYTSIASNSKILSTTHNTLKQNIDSTYTDLSYSYNVEAPNVSSVSSGDIIRTQNTAQKINQILSSWENSYTHYPFCTDFSSFNPCPANTPCPAHDSFHGVGPCNDSVCPDGCDAVCGYTPGCTSDCTYKANN